MKIKPYVLVAALLLPGIPAVAHHAVSAEFNDKKIVTLKGVISKVDWVNPHIFVYFDAKDETGKVTTWRLQSDPPMFFKGSGLNKEKLMDGSDATVTVYPAKDGTEGFGFLVKLTYADGHFYNLGGGAAGPGPGAAPAK